MFVYSYDIFLFTYISLRMATYRRNIEFMFIGIT